MLKNLGIENVEKLKSTLVKPSAVALSGGLHGRLGWTARVSQYVRLQKISTRKHDVNLE